ncbi:MAG TPA: multicopper oxidase domain-containing protein [Anaerolineales bacterium]|jgi:FtsP/CotA-like multicopper oxidase with cupredoxin domain
MISRRDFLKLAGAGSAAVYLSSLSKFIQPASGLVPTTPQVILPGTAIPKFVSKLPELGGLDPIVDDGSQIELEMVEFDAQVLPTPMPKTTVWGYKQTVNPDGTPKSTRESYIGPVIVATRGQPTEMKVINNLGSAAGTKVLAYKYSTDQTLHWADPLNNSMNMWNHMSMPPAFGSEGAENYLGSIPACVHLHGGEVPPVLDGGPDAWFTSDGSVVGAGYYSMDGNAPKNYSIYRYPNSQEGAPIWFHDHTLGATRLNVYAGLAGGYVIKDPTNDPKNLPPLVPLVIQDRMFDTNGQLFFTAGISGGLLWALNPEHPYWNPEFVGDVICVNGKAWPFMEVEPKRYTFLFLNGSNARTYEMFLVDPVSGNPGPNIWVIGTDGGYLDKPVKVGPTAGRKNTKLTMMSGERYQAIIDFAGFQAGVIGPNGLPYSGNWLLKNTAKTPFPGGAASIGATTAQIMQFRVVLPLASPDTSFNPALLGATLRGGLNQDQTQTKQGPVINRLVDPATGTLKVKPNFIRQLTLNEVMGMGGAATNPIDGTAVVYPGGPLEILVNNTKWDGKQIDGVVTDPKDPMFGMYTFKTRADFTKQDSAGNWISENPKEGDIEVWEIVNLTADAHPIHLHLVQFQLINRENFDVAKYSTAYAAAFPGGGYDPMTKAPYPAKTYIPGFGPPLDYNTGNARALGGNPDIAAKDPKGRVSLYLRGTPTLPMPQEAGWKDTVIVYPGQVTRIVVRWATTDGGNPFPFDPAANDQGYVWHCHIVDHEDNEMMRPDMVNPKAGANRNYTLGTDY